MQVKLTAEKKKAKKDDKKNKNYYKEFFKALFRLMRNSSVESDTLIMWGLLTRAWISAAGTYLTRFVGLVTLSIPWF